MPIEADDWVPPQPNWLRCQWIDDGAACEAVCIDGFDRCLAHLHPIDLEGVLARIRPGADLDARGTTISEELLTKILRAFRSPDGELQFGIVDFWQARFEGAADFSKARFKDAGFNRAIFMAEARFEAAIFEAAARFNRAEFMGEARFDRAELKNAGFNRAHFMNDAWFSKARFTSAAGFDAARFVGAARFNRSSFMNDAKLNGVVFTGAVGFNGAQFAGNARFNRSVFVSVARFGGAMFARDAQFERVNFLGLAAFNTARVHNARFDGATFALGMRLDEAHFDFLNLSNVRFGDDMRALSCYCEQFDAPNVQCPAELNIQLTGGMRMDASRTRCASEFTIRLVAGNVTVTDVAFESPATIAAPAMVGEGVDTHSDSVVVPAPRLLSLARVDAANLTLVGLNLSACRFLECYNRDQLRIDGRLQFARQPKGLLWTRRQVIAEEHLWRARYSLFHSRWFTDACRHPGEARPEHLKVDQRARLEAARIQTVYRDLRKGREDAKDEPGAADFYYGEMEMRRHAASFWSSERLLLTAYWAATGYGLRGSRALLALMALILGTALGFSFIGFVGRSPSYVDSIIYAAGSVLSLSLTNHHVPTTLTRWGEVMRIILRVGGPICLALIALAIRGRVKR